MPHGPTFPLTDIPFSAQGSWLSLSPVISQHESSDSVHLVSHTGGMHPVLSLQPYAGTDPVAAHTHATPSALILRHGQHDIEAAFQGADTVRLRGRGLGLRISAAAPELTPFTGTYLITDPADGSYLFTSYETGRRYRLTLISGSARITGDQSLGRATRSVTITPSGPTDVWEAAIEELTAARAPYRSPDTHETVAARARGRFADYADHHIPWAASSTPAAELAAYVLWSASVSPAGFLDRPAVLMSKHWMNKVWSWDHCFNALALAEGDPSLALDQFLLPFDHQDRSGALPDSITHSEVLYNFVKPPIHGWALRKLREHVPLTHVQLSDLYGRLDRWSGFWLNSRRAPGAVLPHYQHGNDSGWDNSTAFDAARTLVSADLAAFLVLQLDELSRLAAELGLAEAAKAHQKTADEILDALINRLWDGDSFHAYPAGDEQARSTGDSLLHLMPIVLGERLPSDVSHRLAERISGHLTPYGLATEKPDSPHYEADGYWRGPIWAPTTVLVEDGLRRAGHTRLADEISSRFRHLCETHGFAENFDALTGQGLRDRAYTWTASSYLLLARDHLRRREATGPAH